ncbi:MAG: UvrD-helicase domain-containing protein [Candidatus Binataceae bacterium]
MASVQLDDLNPAQREAVLAGDGPILILAGAGSGKTRAITYRIARLIAEHKAAPDEVMALTFTNKAAGEMRERVSRLVGVTAQLPWVSTFHSACARILRRDIGALGYERNFTILDQGDSMTLLRRMVAEAAIVGAPAVELVRARIEQAKNEAVSAEEFAARAGDGIERAVAELYRLYQQQLRAMNALDFGDLLLLTYRLFAEKPAALARWQARAAHLLVDEYQDTNRVQYLIVRALSGPAGNLCVVGDEDQSIYRWRGADIRNILDFERDFPAARVFKLEQNYRSTKTILAAAHAVIRNNLERKPKRLWTENADGEPIVYYTGLTERDEADFIANEIARLLAGGMRAADFVVFYRVNAQSRVIEEALVRRRVPYYVVGGVRFYEQREIKDLLAYLKVIANPKDAVSLERMVGVPPRGIGDKTVEAIREVAARGSIGLFEAMGRLEPVSAVAPRIAKQASALYEWMRELIARAEEMTVGAILDQVIARSGFLAYLDGLADGAARRQNLDEMLAAANAFDAERGAGAPAPLELPMPEDSRQFLAQRPVGTGLADFLERIALVSDADQIAEQGGRVALMTLHTSKGLEYPGVFVTGMEEGLFPHSRASDNGIEVEEERRLCYVGMTRARQLLYLTNTLSRELYGKRIESRPSRFLNEIDPALIRRIAPERVERLIRRPPPGEPYVDYSTSQLPNSDEDGTPGEAPAVGLQVMHATFGRGIVRKREGRGEAAKVWVDFGRRGVKLLVLKYASLRPVSD